MDSPGKNTGVGCHFLLQVIFPTKQLNLGLLHCRQILYQLSYKENFLVVCYSAINRNDIVLLAEMWLDLEIIIWSELSQKEKNKHHIILLICGI